MDPVNVPLPFQETVEAHGHLIDSHIMERIFDTVVEFQGRFEVEIFQIGRTNSDPSHLRLKIETPDRERMDSLLGQLLGLGCTFVLARSMAASAVASRVPLSRTRPRPSSSP